MTELDKSGFTFVDGVGGINMADGVVRIDLVAISGFEQDKAVAQRAGGLAISLTGFVKMHEQMSKVIDDMVQKGVLQKRENDPKATPLALQNAQVSEENDKGAKSKKA
jgi:hypothetical protein